MTANVEVTIQIKSVPQASGCGFYIIPRTVAPVGDCDYMRWQGENYVYIIALHPDLDLTEFRIRNGLGLVVHRLHAAYKRTEDVMNISLAVKDLDSYAVILSEEDLLASDDGSLYRTATSMIAQNRYRLTSHAAEALTDIDPYLYGSDSNTLRALPIVENLPDKYSDLVSMLEARLFVGQDVPTDFKEFYDHVDSKLAVANDRDSIQRKQLLDSELELAKVKLEVAELKIQLFCKGDSA